MFEDLGSFEGESHGMEFSERGLRSGVMARRMVESGEECASAKLCLPLHGRGMSVRVCL